MFEHICSRAGLDEGELDAIDRASDELIAAAVDFALASPEPPVGRLAAGREGAGQRGAVRTNAARQPFGELALSFDAGLGE